MGSTFLPYTELKNFSRASRLDYRCFTILYNFDNIATVTGCFVLAHYERFFMYSS